MRSFPSLAVPHESHKRDERLGESGKRKASNANIGAISVPWESFATQQPTLLPTPMKKRDTGWLMDSGSGTRLAAVDGLLARKRTFPLPPRLPPTPMKKRDTGWLMDSGSGTTLATAGVALSHRKSCAKINWQ